MSGPPSPPRNTATNHATQNGSSSANGHTKHNNAAATDKSISDVPLVHAPPDATKDVSPLSSVLKPDPLLSTGDGTKLDSDEEALRQSEAVVASLGQMDLLALVLDLMERVSSGSVTAKTVDNEVSKKPR